MAGYTLMHEHITIDLSGPKNDPDCRLDCFQQTVEELKELKRLGVSNILDVTNQGMGQNVRYVEHAAKEAGIRIFHSTGAYKEPFLPWDFKWKTVEEIAFRMIADIREGLQNTEIRAVAIGEIGTSLNKMTILEKKLFEAAIIAHRETGKIITTHTSLGTYGMEQIEFFKKHNVDLSKIIIGHVDLTGDEHYIEMLLKEGVNVEFDTIGKNNYQSDDLRADILASLIKKGYDRRLLLSVDITRKSHLKAFGGIGYSYLFEKFLPMLRNRGVGEESINEMLVKNPKRLLGSEEFL